MGKLERKEAKIERDETKKVTSKVKAEKDAQDAYWAANGENDKSKAAKKREEEDRKRADTLAKKAEAKRLADAELEEITKAKVKAEKAGNQKQVTHFQLQKQREFEERAKAEEQAERDLASRRELSAEQYARQVETENVNRGVEGVDARGVDAALKVLTIKEEEADKHPEKRMKAAWKAYEERTLATLKEEKPGLKMSQYKDMMWKSWQKAPENPLNQVQLASPTTPKQG